MTTNSTIQLVDAPVFEGITKRERSALDHLVTEIHVSAGKVLARQGSVGREFGVVVSGCVEVERDGEVVARLGPGEYFGEMALLDASSSKWRRNATVRATTEVRLAVMSTREFHQVIDTMPAAAAQIRAAAERRRVKPPPSTVAGRLPAWTPQVSRAVLTPSPVPSVL